MWEAENMCVGTEIEKVYIRVKTCFRLLDIVNFSFKGARNAISVDYT